MFFTRKHSKEDKRKEAEIQAIRKDTLNSIERAKLSTSKVNDLLEDQNLGTTELIFLATGGDRRK